MALKAIYENQDDIPEEYSGLFTEKSGKWELTEVDGLKTTADVERLQTSLTKERDLHKATKEKLGKFGDLDPESSQGLAEEVEELRIKLEAAEAAAGDGKVDEEKVQRLVDAQVAKEVRPLERELEKLKTTNQEQADTIAQHETKDRNRTISDAVREAAGESKLISSAIDDALVLAERMFEVDESGAVLTRDNVGVTPAIDPKTWLTEMQEKRPHWWPAAEGSGAGGGGGGGAGSGDNPFSHKGWNITKQGQMVREDPNRAERMAKSAGTTVGGPKPVAPAA